MGQVFDDQEAAWFDGGKEWYERQHGGKPCDGIAADFDPYVFWAETSDDDDYSAIWADMKEESKKKKLSNREWSVNFLKEKGIELKLLSDNSGHYRYGDYDFWPATGKFMHIKTKKQGRGVRNLYNLIK